MSREPENIYQSIVQGNFEFFIKYAGDNNNFSRFNRNNMTILHNASNVRKEWFNPKILKYILKNGDLDINAKTNEGWTTLYCAVESKNTEALTILLEAGANPNIRSRDCHTPLSLAFERIGSHVENINILLNNGADPDIELPEISRSKGVLRHVVIDQLEEMLGRDSQYDLPFIPMYQDLKKWLDEIPVGSRTNPDDNPVEIKETVKPENWTYKDIVELFVPSTGLADSKQGELARVLGRLSHEYHNNGNVNWDESYVKLAGWLLQNLSDDSVFNAKQILQIKQDIDQIFNNAQTGRGAMSPEEPHYSRLKQCVVIWCKQNPEKIEYNSGLPF